MHLRTVIPTLKNIYNAPLGGERGYQSIKKGTKKRKMFRREDGEKVKGKIKLEKG
jgi:hypothetical protein